MDLRKLVDKEMNNQILSNNVLNLSKQKDHKIQMRMNHYSCAITRRSKKGKQTKSSMNTPTSFCNYFM